jgi:hypothetical protein
VKYSNSIIDAFFLLVRAGLFGRTEDMERILSDGVDWPEVYQIAREQSMLGLVAEGIEVIQGESHKGRGTQLVPHKWTVKFGSSALRLEQFNLDMNKFIARLFHKMRKQNCFPILLKGQGLAMNYEKPLRRSCGDIDILLTGDDYQKAKDFLLPYASFSEPENVHKMHLAMKIDNFEVELHGTLRCGFSARVDKELDKICRETSQGGTAMVWKNGKVEVPLLGLEDNVFYVFSHILNHFYKSGIGIKQICDLCRLLWASSDSLNLTVLEARLRGLRLMSEWRAFARYSVEYLGMPEQAMPFFSGEEKWGRKARRIHSFILKTGNMGKNRKVNDSAPSYLRRKLKSSVQRTSDLANHLMIFPLDTLRFLPSIFLNGIRQK